MQDVARTLDPDVRLLQALADPVRLSIVRQLGSTEEVCACDFVGLGTVSQPTVSHHLKVLREAGLVRADRRGTWIWYSLEPGAVERLRTLTADLVPGRRLAASVLRSRGDRDSSHPAGDGCDDCDAPAPTEPVFTER